MLAIHILKLISFPIGISYQRGKKHHFIFIDHHLDFRKPNLLYSVACFYKYEETLVRYNFNIGTIDVIDKTKSISYIRMSTDKLLLGEDAHSYKILPNI